MSGSAETAELPGNERALPRTAKLYPGLSLASRGLHTAMHAPLPGRPGVQDSAVPRLTTPATPQARPCPAERRRGNGPALSPAHSRSGPAPPAGRTRWSPGTDQTPSLPRLASPAPGWPDRERPAQSPGRASGRRETTLRAPSAWSPPPPPGSSRAPAAAAGRGEAGAGPGDGGRGGITWVNTLHVEPSLSAVGGAGSRRAERGRPATARGVCRTWRLRPEKSRVR